jgi:hypothetical protein
MRDVQEDHQMRTTIEMAHEVYGEHTFWNEAQLLRLKEFERLVRADEREACAKVCETYNKRQCYNDEDMAVANECAAAIRNRGNT